jgi:hypothetical protein
MKRPLEEIIDIEPHCDVPVLVSRGVLYAVLRQRGESDFIAGCYAFKGDAYTEGGNHKPLSIEHLHAHFNARDVFINT